MRTTARCGRASSQGEPELLGGGTIIGSAKPSVRDERCMYGIRIKRDNAIAAYTYRNFRCPTFMVEEKFHYQPLEGLRKSGIVATMGRLRVVIDAQVAGQQSDLEGKYADNPDIKGEITRKIVATFTSL